jgi:hypothetical protein
MHRQSAIRILYNLDDGKMEDQEWLEMESGYSWSFAT